MLPLCEKIEMTILTETNLRLNDAEGLWAVVFEFVKGGGLIDFLRAEMPTDALFQLRPKQLF